MRDKDLLKALIADGWKLVRIKGSHHVLQKDGKSVPFLTPQLNQQVSVLNCGVIVFFPFRFYNRFRSTSTI